MMLWKYPVLSEISYKLHVAVFIENLSKIVAVKP